MSGAADEKVTLRPNVDVEAAGGAEGAPRGSVGAAASREGNAPASEPAEVRATAASAADRAPADAADDRKPAAATPPPPRRTAGYGAVSDDVEQGARRHAQPTHADSEEADGRPSRSVRSGSDSGAHERASSAAPGAAPDPDGGGAARRRTRRVRAWGPSPCCVYYRVGALSVICEWRDSGGRKTRLFLGPYWAWLLATLSTLSAIAGVVYFVVVPDAPWTLRGTGLGLSGLSLVLLLATAMSDPGIFRRHTRPMADDWTWSEVAQSYRPPGTVYCQESEVLIEVRARATAAAAARPPLPLRLRAAPLPLR